MIKKLKRSLLLIFFEKVMGRRELSSWYDLPGEPGQAHSQMRFVLHRSIPGESNLEIHTYDKNGRIRDIVIIKSDYKAIKRLEGALVRVVLKK